MKTLPHSLPVEIGNVPAFKELAADAYDDGVKANATGCILHRITGREFHILLQG